MNNIKKNYIYNVSYQIFALLVPLITTPYVSRVLGVEGIGIYSYTYSMVRYFWILSAIGTTTYGMRIIGISQGDLEKRSEKFWNLFSLKIILSTIFIGTYLIYIFFIAENKIIALIQGIYLLAVTFDIAWFYQGMENFKKIIIKNFIIKVLNIIFIFLFIRKKEDLVLYIFGLAFFQLLGNLSMWISLKKLIRPINFKKLHPLQYLKPCLELFIPGVATQIFAIIDKSMIGWITHSLEENGVYEQAFKIIDMALVLITTLGTVMIPSISREFKNGNKEIIREKLDLSFKFTFFLAFAMIFGIIGISSKFVPIFFGNGYEKSIIILNILSILFLFMGINNIIGNQYLISTDQQNIHTKYLIIGGIINVILNIILIKYLGAIGAAIASVIGEGIIMCLEIRFLYKSKQYNFFENLKYILKYLVSSLIMFLFISVCRNFMTNIYKILFIIIIAFSIYILCLIFMKDELVTIEIKKSLYKIKDKFLKNEG